MNTLKHQIFLMVSFFIAQSVFAQEQLLIRYEGKILSGAIVNRLRSEVSDPEYLQAYYDLLGQYRVSYVLYVDQAKGQTLLVEESEQGLDGPPPYKVLASFADNSGFSVEVFFRGRVFFVQGKRSQLRWKLTGETQKIGKFDCRKAILENDPFNSIAWFTEQYPVPYGPAFGVGLPGLVVLYENDYYKLSVGRISSGRIPTKLEKQILEMDKKKGVELGDFYQQTKSSLEQMGREDIIDP